MTEGNTEILVGVLIVACVLLMYCRSKKSTDGMKSLKAKIPGLQFRDGYQSYSTNIKPDYAYMPSKLEGMDEGTSGLNEQESFPTSASLSVTPPSGNENRLNWIPDVSISQNSYDPIANVMVDADGMPVEFTRDNMVHDTTLNSDNDKIWNTIYNRGKSRPLQPTPGNPSVGGASMHLIDTQPQRQYLI